jgi:hypothetical protein
MVARNSALSRLNVSSQFAPVHAVPISNSSRATHKQCEGAPLPTGYPRRAGSRESLQTLCREHRGAAVVRLFNHSRPCLRWMS